MLFSAAVATATSSLLLFTLSVFHQAISGRPSATAQSNLQPYTNSTTVTALQQ